MHVSTGQPQQPVMHLVYFHLRRNSTKGNGEKSWNALSAAVTDCTQSAQTGKGLATKSTIKKGEMGSAFHSYLLSV